MSDNLPPLPDHWIPLGFIGTNASFQRTAREYAEDYARAAIKASRAAVPAGLVMVPMGTLNHWKAQVNQVAALSLKKDRWATGAALKQEIADMIAAAPQPVAQPGELAKPMNAHRAAYFMWRFLNEEKLLGPNEQAALRFAIAALESV